MRASRLLAGAVAIAGVSAACGGGPAASVGDVRISHDAIERELAAIMSNRDYIKRYEREARADAVDTKGRPTKILKSVTLTNDITFVGVERLARERRVRVTSKDRREGRKAAPGVVGGPELFERFPAWYQRDLERRTTLARAVQRSFVETTTPERFYRQNKREFVRACTHDILLKTKADAEAARRRILAGESFASVARDVSIDTGTGPRGGFLACNERGDLVLELDAAAFTLPIGEISEPIEIENGFHIFMVSSRKTPPLKEIRGEIQAAIEKGAAEAMRSLLRLRLRQLGVEVDDSYGRWIPERIVVAPA